MGSFLPHRGQERGGYVKVKLDWKRLFSKKSTVICACLFLAGLLLVIASGAAKKEEALSESAPRFDEIAYTQALENRLCAHLCAIEGAGEVRVMLTLETAGEQNYSRDYTSEHTASDNADNGRESASVVLKSEKNGVKSPVLESESLPRVRGVCVVATGARTPAVKLKLTEALQALLGIRASQISVVA